MKTTVILLLLFLLGVCSLPAEPLLAAEPVRWALALGPTPVLNTPDFEAYFGGGRRLDHCNGVRPVEFVALPGTRFRIEGEERRHGHAVYRVTTRDYPYRSDSGYYVDARFVKLVEGGTDRISRLPARDEIERRMVALAGKPYVWGGNVGEGVPLLEKLYPGADTLAGVDCSGLLYQATDGFTPRNSSALVYFGEPVQGAGLGAEELAARLKPLDLLVWKGHVMIVIGGNRVIESRMGCQGGSGVQIEDLKGALRHLMKSRRPYDDWSDIPSKGKGFVVRRWYGVASGVK